VIKKVLERVIKKCDKNKGDWKGEGKNGDWKKGDWKGKFFQPLCTSPFWLKIIYICLKFVQNWTDRLRGAAWTWPPETYFGLNGRWCCLHIQVLNLQLFTINLQIFAIILKIFTHNRGPSSCTSHLVQNLIC